MTKIVEHTKQRLVVENKPRIAFGLAITLGVIALFGSLYPVLFLDKGFSKDIIMGLILGPLFAVGGLFLYRETVTVFDKPSGRVNWKQQGFKVNRSDSAEISQIQDVVVGHPVSDESGGATKISLILQDRTIPLMFGFSATNKDNEIADKIKSFIKGS